MADKRAFKLVKVGHKKDDGKSVFVGSTPSGAASKAFNRWCKDNKKGVCRSKAIVVEDVSKGKQYKYEGKRLKNPTSKQTVVRGGTPVVHKYTTKIVSKK